MNKNIDLTKILKDCPKGWKFYSSIYGDLLYSRMYLSSSAPKITFIKPDSISSVDYYQDGKRYLSQGECTLFPSKDQRDWSKFTAPWYKKEMDINSMGNKDDERLRKTAIAFLKDFAEQGYENAVECIDWLEKQGEPNPYSGVSFKYNGHTWGMCARDNGVEILVDGEIKERIFLDNEPQDKSALEVIKEEKVDNEPKFKVGDWVVRGDTIAQIVDIQKQYYVGLDINGKDFVSSRFLNGDKIHLWTINDAKDGDVLALSWLEDKNLWAKIVIFKKYHSEGVKGLYNYNMPCVEGYGITFKNGKTVFNERIPYYSKTWTCNLHPATKEQRDLLFQKMKEAGYKWNTETNTFEKFYL